MLEQIQQDTKTENLIKLLRDDTRMTWEVEEAINLLGESHLLRMFTGESTLLDALKHDEKLVDLFVRTYLQSSREGAWWAAAQVLAVFVRIIGRDTAIGARVYHEAIEPWLDDLAEEGEDRQRQALCILSLFREPQAVPFLLEALKDQDRQAQYLAAFLLLAFYDDTRADQVTLEALHSQDPDWRIMFAEALAEKGDKSGAEPLIQTLDDEDSLIRDRAISTLGRIGGRRAVEALTDVVFYHADRHTRSSALCALAAIGDPATLDVFRRALKDADPSVRSAASDGLRSWVMKESDVDHLRQIYAVMLEDGEPYTKVYRTTVVTRFATIGTPEAIRAIEEALDDPHELVRCIAIAYLGGFGSAAALPALARVVAEDTGVIGNRPLADMARDSIEEIRKRCGEC